MAHTTITSHSSDMMLGEIPLCEDLTGNAVAAPASDPDQATPVWDPCPDDLSEPPTLGIVDPGWKFQKLGMVDVS